MALKLTKRFLLIHAITSLIICFPYQNLFAQTGAPLFKVIHLPRKAGYSKEKLNTELSPLKDKEAVKRLFRAKNFPPQTSIVLYINRANNQSAYWTINTSSPTDKEDNRIILQSRDNTSTKVFKLSEFKNFFKDTLAIIDTLSIELFIKDNDYPDDQYALATICGKTASKKNVPFIEDKLIFSKGVADNCKAGLPLVSLCNNNNPDRILASCRLNFLTTDQQEMLLSMASFIKTEEPAKDPKDVALLLYGYSLNHFGRLHFPQLLNWLEKNNVATKHGDHQ